MSPQPMTLQQLANQTQRVSDCHSAFVECIGSCGNKWNHSLFVDQFAEGQTFSSCQDMCTSSRTKCLRGNEGSIDVSMQVEPITPEQLANQTREITACHSEFVQCIGACGNSWNHSLYANQLSEGHTFSSCQ